MQKRGYSYKMKINLSEAIKETLTFVAKGVLLYIAASSPRGAKVVIKEVQKMSAQRQYRIKKRLERLERAGMIILGGEKITLTKRGQDLLRLIQIEEIDLDQNTWAGIWHIVAYDIPTTLNKNRDSLRLQLKKWGFRQIHKSVWVTPYECKEEVAVVAQALNIAPFVLYMNATDLPMAHNLKKLFHLE